MDWTAGPGQYDVFNLGESRTISLDEMIEALERALGVKAQIERLPPQPGDVRRTCADISRARAVLGYNPATSFDAGLSAFVRWLEGERALA